MRLSQLLILGSSGAQEHSLISAVRALVGSNQVFLGGILLAVVFFLPLHKLLYLLLLALLSPAAIVRSEPTLRAVAWLGRWWPHDLAALAAAAALVASHAALAQRLAAGAYCFAAAIFAMALAYVWLRPEAADLRWRAPAGHAASLKSPAFAVLVAFAVLAFVGGVTLPVLRLNAAYAGAKDHSIVSVVLALRKGGETVLWAAILTLAILLPGLRLIYLLTVAATRARPRIMRSKTIEALGRHATADTMVLSLMLFYLIETGQAHAVLQPGVYCLAASAALALAGYTWANLPASAAGARRSSLMDELAKVNEVAKP
jgi:uncharacterized paraquat-inducible protein A